MRQRLRPQSSRRAVRSGMRRWPRVKTPMARAQEAFCTAAARASAEWPKSCVSGSTQSMSWFQSTELARPRRPKQILKC